MANSASFSISYVYRVVDRYTAKLSKISRGTDRLRKKLVRVEAAAKRFSNRMASFQSAAAGAAAVIGGKALLDQYVAFETAQNNLASVAFTSEEKLKSLRDMSKQLGIETKFTATQVTEGMHALKIGGLEVDQVLAAIPKTLQLAAAGSLELGTAAGISVKVMNQLGYGIEDLAKINNILVLAQSKASFNITEFFEAMKVSAPLARNTGMSFELLAANLGLIADAGNAGSLGARHFRMAILKLSTAKEKQIKVLQRLGIDYDKIIDKTGKLKDGIKSWKYLIDELTRIKIEGKLPFVKILEYLFGIQGMQSIMHIVGQGTDKLVKFNTAFTDVGDAAEKATKLQMRGLPGIILTMISALEGLNIFMFESGLDKTVGNLGKGVTNIARGMADMNPLLLRVIGTLGLVLAIVAPLTVVMGVMAASIGAIAAAFGVALSPILLVVGAVIGLTTGLALFIKYKKQLGDIMDEGGLIKKMLPERKKLVTGVTGMWDIATGEMEDLAGTTPERSRASKRVLDKMFEGIRGKGFFSKPVFGKTDITASAVPILGKTDITASAVQEQKSLKGFLNGEIKISAAPGTKVEEATFYTDFPGDLGVNLAGAQ